ncbi:CCA tRNA nucleotidyltransferase [uncultured Shimia sp.]|uniref:CCA tRNA nucleotidyltransferase n=1 Tax=uncultured Shimia sp. TaxID=573152 RepID=UPI00262E5F34|nr:CCA tRNA nucleotidyltransferase [uncultured Shimia sp.]
MTHISGDWLDNPQTKAVCAMLTDAGYQALFVGGCVRNALMGVAVNDLDIATDAHPQVVLDLARKVGFQAIPTGIDHGTITVVSGGIPHEITTFRKDVETDGRHAVVAFSSCVEDDARRRDFTMNALYARPDGTVVDPLGGMSDLEARQVRFIDNAQLRIREDYLRILRYFRFHAWYGDASKGMDPDAHAAIAECVEGIAGLSKERLGAEVLKLLAAPDPAPAVAAMRHAGVLTQVIEGADDRALAPLVHLESLIGAEPDALTRLAALGGMNVSDRLRLSKKQARQLDKLRDEVASAKSASALAYHHGVHTARAIMLLRAALLETPLAQTLMQDLETGAKAVFPIKPQDLMPAFQGAALGAELSRLEGLWISSGFTLTRDTLLSQK